MKNPIAYCPIFGGGAVLIYAIDYIEDKVQVAFSGSKPLPRWVKIRYNNYGHPYFRKNDQTYYFSECMKVGV